MTCLPQNIEWLQIINNRSCDMKCCPNLILKLHCSKKVLFCKVWIIIVLCNFAENVPWPSEQQWSHGRRCTMGHIVEQVVQMAIFLLLSAALQHILLNKICCASVQHSLSPPESFIVGSMGVSLYICWWLHIHWWRAALWPLRPSQSFHNHKEEGPWPLLGPFPGWKRLWWWWAEKMVRARAVPSLPHPGPQLRQNMWQLWHYGLTDEI